MGEMWTRGEKEESGKVGIGERSERKKNKKKQANKKQNNDDASFQVS